MSIRSTIDTADNIQYSIYLSGLSEQTITSISKDIGEPDRMLEHRLKSFVIFQQTALPNWGPDISGLNLDNIVYYARPEKGYTGYADSRDKVPQDIKNKFDKLGIPAAEKNYLAGAGGQYDAEMVYHKLKEKYAQMGVIFDDMSNALREHEELVRKYFMKLVPNTDHKFAALHGAVRSGGTFIYIPKGVHVSEPLQAYFRMNTLGGGQFEHTLIIVEDDAVCDYIEGCSAPKFDNKSIHAGLVEIHVGKNARMRYSSVENRSINTYNLNTKRAIVDDDSVMEWIGGNLGSGTTMLYPCTILKGKRSKADHIGVAVATAGQHQDVGAKVIHIGQDSSSTIISKSISKDGGVNTYRGIVDIKSTATGATNSTECDALLMDDFSVSTTIPTIKVDNPYATVAHEASAGKIDEAMIFYLTSRGLNEEKAMAMIVNGFISPVIKRLPLEYAGELNKLIEMEMEGSVG
ncbi:MAG: Fe-S cluster assembly protein SufB [Candidatus Absconditabacterales bacterium]